MDAATQSSSPADAPPDGTATFELEAFAWAAPDQLRVAGRFAGLRDAPTQPPALVVHGDRTHRLPAVPDSVSGPPEDGRPWSAVFAWQEPPIPFTAAELELGGGMVIGLPSMDARGSRPVTLDVRRPDGQRSQDDARDALRVRTDLLAAQDEALQARAALEDAQVALARAREDLQAERDRRAADAERFRAGLADVRRSAEEAVGAEQARGEALAAELEEARRALEAARAEREEAEAAARAETDEIRARVAALEPLEQEVAALRSERDEVARAAEQARAEAEQVRNRIEVIRRALADEG